MNKAEEFYRASGLSNAQCAAMVGISVSVFKYWRRGLVPIDKRTENLLDRLIAENKKTRRGALP